MLELNKIYLGDCLEVMSQIDDGSIDMVLADLPFGSTACAWDIVIPFEPLWQHYKRITKANGAIVLCGRNPFFARLICSNLEMYRYELIWDKNTATDFAQANNKPITVHENIGVFYREKPSYNRIDDNGFKSYSDRRTFKQSSALGAKGLTNRAPIENRSTRVPTTIRRYFPDNKKGKGSSLQDTQKPLALFEFLVRAYTKENELVLDSCAGSGTTGEACLNTKRNFILIEKKQEHFEKAQQRLQKAKQDVQAQLQRTAP